MTDTKTNLSPIAALIAGAMRDESTALNRSAALIAIMFKNEVTYSKEALAAILRLQKDAKTDAINAAICDVSPEFAEMLDHDNALAEKRKADKASYTERDGEVRIVYGKQMRAARMMFERALIACYGLRKNNALEVTTSKKRTGMLSIEFLKSREGDKIKTTDKDLSCNDLIRAGTTALNDDAIRAKTAQTAARNPAANVLSDASKSLAATLSNMAADGKRKPITDFADDVEANMNATLRELFLMKFADDRGKVNDKDVLAWVAEITKTAADRVASVKAGVEKLVADEKAKKAAAG